MIKRKLNKTCCLIVDLSLKMGRVNLKKRMKIIKMSERMSQCETTLKQFWISRQCVQLIGKNYANVGDILDIQKFFRPLKLDKRD